MEIHRISRTQQDALEFEGLLLAKANSPRLESESGVRGYELALYRKAHGGFVVSIEYQTTCPRERCVMQAEIVDEPQDVENVLLVFEPCEHLDQQTLRLLQTEPRQRLQKRLCRLYDEQVTQILDALAPYHGDRRDAPKSPEEASEPEQQHGIWGFLRLK